MSRFLKDSAERYFQKTAKLMQKEKYKEALKEIEKAQNIVKELNEKEYILIFSSLKGHLLYLLGRYEESLEIHTFGLKYNEEILSRGPYNKIYESAFTVSFLDVFALGNIFYNTGNFFRAKDCYEFYLLISQRLLKANPENLSYLSDVAMALNNLGALLTNIGHFKEAKGRFEEALEIRQKFLEVTPEDATYKSDVAMTLNNLGGLLTKMGSIEEAKKKLEKALELRLWLLKKYPENLLYQSYVGGTFVNLGVLFKDMGQLEEARDRYEEALEIYEKLATEDSEDSTYRTNFAGLLDNLGKLLSDMGRIEQAKQWHEKALKIRQDLIKDKSENVAYQSYLGQINNSLGNMSKWEEAGQEIEDFIEHVYSISLKNENLKNFKIEKNHVEIGKSSTKYEFDVFYEVKIAGIFHKVAIECKYHDKRITEDMVRDFWGKLNDCNNIRGFMVSTNGHQEEAKQLLKYYGIDLITEEELPNIHELLLAYTECLVPDENVQGDPFWTIMQLTEDGKSTGSYYSSGDNVFNIFVPAPFRRGNIILLFISKKSAERVLKADGAEGYAVFGVSRQHLKAICLMSKVFRYELGIISVLSLNSYGNSLLYKHSYDQILGEYDLE